MKIIEDYYKIIETKSNFLDGFMPVKDSVIKITKIVNEEIFYQVIEGKIGENQNSLNLRFSKGSKADIQHTKKICNYSKTYSHIPELNNLIKKSIKLSNI